MAPVWDHCQERFRASPQYRHRLQFKNRVNEKRAEQPGEFRCPPGAYGGRQEAGRVNYVEVIEGAHLKLIRLICPLQPVVACGEERMGEGQIETKPKDGGNKKEVVSFMLFILTQLQRAPCYLGELP